MAAIAAIALFVIVFAALNIVQSGRID